MRKDAPEDFTQADLVEDLEAIFPGFQVSQQAVEVVAGFHRGI